MDTENTCNSSKYFNDMEESEVKKQELYVDIKKAEENELDVLVRQFSPRNPQFQYNRYDVQRKGEGIYLIAWHNQTPIGHFLLIWSGPRDIFVEKHVDIRNRAYLEAGYTIEEFQNKGVGTAIIQMAEKLAKERGCLFIGLEVGVENPNAKRLYKALGFKEWEYGDFQISWEYRDHVGNKGIETEQVVYMEKIL